MGVVINFSVYALLKENRRFSSDSLEVSRRTLGLWGALFVAIQGALSFFEDWALCSGVSQEVDPQTP